MQKVMNAVTAVANAMTRVRGQESSRRAIIPPPGGGAATGMQDPGTGARPLDLPWPGRPLLDRLPAPLFAAALDGVGLAEQVSVLNVSTRVRAVAQQSLALNPLWRRVARARNEHAPYRGKLEARLADIKAASRRHADRLNRAKALSAPPVAGQETSHAFACAALLQELNRPGEAIGVLLGCPQSLERSRWIARLHLQARDFGDAVRVAEEALATAAAKSDWIESDSLLQTVTEAHLCGGNLELAEASLKRMKRPDEVLRAIVLQRSGRKKEAATLIGDLMRTSSSPRVLFALVVIAGDAETDANEAREKDPFTWLEGSDEEGAPNPAGAAVDLQNGVETWVHSPLLEPLGNVPDRAPHWRQRRSQWLLALRYAPHQLRAVHFDPLAKAALVGVKA